MPTVVIQPQPNSPFGAGRPFAVVTTTVGPFLDPFWEWVWTPDDGNDGEVISGRINTSDPHVPSVVNPWPSVGTTFPIKESFRQGTTGHLKVDLFSNEVSVESTVVPVIADFTIGTLAQINDHLTQVATGSSGNTDTLEQILDAVYRRFITD